MTPDNRPKVFISYSWAVQDWTVKLATRLINDGIETKVDFWDLKEGHDKYKFMESMVADKSIDYVLILCDETYAKKANDRTGGVGDETVIISSELYGKSSQTRFLPLVLDKDENGDATVPIYIKSRIYFDFSDEEKYEDEYEKLLRHIYNEPLIPKPALGNKPEWLKKNAINISEIKRFVDVLHSSSNDTRKNIAVSEFTQSFISKVKEFRVNTNPGIDIEKFCCETETAINEMKPLRDTYLDFFKELILSEKNIIDFFCPFMENLYNKLLLLKINGNSYDSNDEAMLELYQIFIWNIFISSIAYLFHYEKFNEIHEILTTTYFLIDGVTTLRYQKPETFLRFRSHSSIFDSYYERKDRVFSKTADIVSHQIKEPILITERFAQTDIRLSQLSFALKISKIEDWGWFALSYVYSKELDDMWIKLASKKYCQKILPLFGVKTIDEFKQLIKDNPVKERYGYPNSWHSIPRIPLRLRDYEIASLN
ncbi:MAG: toll/interleukin-1 receptor domain-containing protein [Treponema sp.]|nr:toll/interleukin-1 receptor domain-containing protein [Treponema sp.]